MRNKLWKKLALATLLAAGVACLWGALVGWGISIYESNMHAYQNYELLRVNPAGEVYIQERQYSAYHDTSTYRTLDGQPVKDFGEEESWASGASLWIPKQAPTGDISINWNLRVLPLARTYASDEWYLVHNGEDEAGRAYLVGYDRQTKLSVGYFGLRGFQRELPAVDQWFVIDGRAVAHGRGAYAVLNGSSTHRVHGNVPVFFKQSRSAEDPILVNLATAEGLIEVDLQNRLLKTKDDRADYHSVAECNVPSRVITAELVPDGVELDEFKHFGEDPEFDRYYKKVQLRSVAGRQKDRVAVFHPTYEERYEFAIPAELQGRNFSFYFLSPEQAVLDVPSSTMHRHVSELFWINGQGEVQKSVEVLLNAGREVSDRSGFAFICLLGPIPLVVVFMTMVFSPFLHPYSSFTMPGSTYGQRLAQACLDGWPAVLVLVLVSALLAWWVLKRHRKYLLRNSLAWSWFVLLLGLPALVAYWFQHPRLAQEECKECGQQAPRDRDACAHCEKPFPAPSQLGTEIFA